MAYQRDVLVLANSYKFRARCVAGKAMNGHNPTDWVRPVSAAESGELSERDVQFENGQSPKLVDVVRIHFKGSRNHPYQAENELIDEAIYWAKLRSASQEEINACLDDVHGPLWLNFSSSYNGLNDEIPEAEAPRIGSSLKFISVNDLVIRVITKFDGKKQVRGRFTLNNILYDLVVTDPIVDSEYLG